MAEAEKKVADDKGKKEEAQRPKNAQDFSALVAEKLPEFSKLAEVRT